LTQTVSQTSDCKTVVHLLGFSLQFVYFTPQGAQSGRLSRLDKFLQEIELKNKLTFKNQR
jgi:hypothetical protein